MYEQNHFLVSDPFQQHLCIIQTLGNNKLVAQNKIETKDDVVSAIKLQNSMI